LTEDVIQKLQDKASVLTAERKKRGKRMPEDLVGSDDIRNYRPVSIASFSKTFIGTDVASVVDHSKHLVTMTE